MKKEWIRNQDGREKFMLTSSTLPIFVERFKKLHMQFSIEGSIGLNMFPRRVGVGVGKVKGRFVKSMLEKKMLGAWIERDDIEGRRGTRGFSFIFWKVLNWPQFFLW